MCVFIVCVVFPFILDAGLVDVPAGVTQEEGHTGLLIPPSFCGACLNLFREKDPAVPSLVDREVEFSCTRSTNELILLHLLGIFFFFFLCVSKIPVRVTAPGFKLTSRRQKASRLPTEPPGRPDAK